MALIRWFFEDGDKKKIDELCEAMGIFRLTGTALVSKGIHYKDAAEQFLRCEHVLGDAMLLQDMDKGAGRVRRAVENGERIAVFGDYDVDGIMSTALLCLYLESTGSDVLPFLPLRDCTGYGLVKTSVDEIAACGATLIITVDNGVSSYEAVAYASEKGIDTVICDHHITPAILPPAVAVIDPLRADDKSSFKFLAGVGVALKFAAAIEGCDVGEMLDQFGYFAAIGTVADVMPLVGENRAIVQQGLSQLAYGDNPGLSALIEETGLDAGNVTAQDVAFSIAPRLNAAGRMASAKTALNLLLTDDPDEAGTLAKELTELNSRRKEAERELTQAVLHDIYENSDTLKQPILIASGYGYNSGVSGIVCSKLVERFAKPVVVIALDGEEARGSGRSLEGFSLYNAVESCADLLLSYGGHDLAAGFTVRTDRVDELKERLTAYCGEQKEQVAYRSMNVAGEIAFSDIGERQVAELLSLAPFGAKNEEPVFATLSAEIAEIAGLGDKHTRLIFEKDGARLKTALFCVTPDEISFRKGDRVDIAYKLSLYTPSEKSCQVSAKLMCVVPEGFSKEDFGTVKLFNGLYLNQELSASEKNEIVPDREDIALVYRHVRDNPFTAASRELICLRFSGTAPGRVLAAVEVLKELGLIVETTGEKVTFTAAKNPEKKELNNSKIYSELHAVR